MKPGVAAATSLLLLCLSLEACGAPTDPPPTPARSANGLSMDLRRRSPMRSRDVAEMAILAKKQRDVVNAKYYAGSRKRSTGYNLIIDQGLDAGYVGSLAIGTPSTSFDVLLDTGSSDLWLASNTCGSSCKGLPTYDPSSSSSFKNLSSAFTIEYGSGEAEGYVAEETVQMAGFSVTGQGFAVVNDITAELLTSPVSGLMGMAWQTLAQTGKTPFWQALASNGALDSALFAFQLRRYSNDSSASQLEPGGQLTFGYTNSSLYTGSIDYVDVSGTPQYWSLPLQSLTVQGNSISIGSGALAAIDTGTTNIAGPSDAIQAIYAQINGSSAGTGQWSGYFQYPCSSSVSVGISFGGNTWTMSSADFQFAQISSSECIGVFFESGTSGAGGDSSTPAWIIGDAFLKNVYSVFRYSPASVGFATLSEVAIAENGVNGAVPSATIGSSVASVTDTSDASPRVPLPRRGVVGPAAVGALLTMMMWAL